MIAMEALGSAAASLPRPTATAAIALNTEQLAVVQAPLDQAVCVLAAAGTGKTTTMSQRVRWMLEQVRGCGGKVGAPPPPPPPHPTPPRPLALYCSCDLTACPCCRCAAAGG